MCSRKASERRAGIELFSSTFKELFEIVTCRQLTEDMIHCWEFLHTGSQENYHNIRLKYLPKRVAFM
jgi:hypothetical protein